MNKPDIATIIDLHFEELTELEQEIARYFLQSDTIQDDLSSQQVTQKLHISQAALTRFAKKCGFTGYREFVFQYQHQTSKQDIHSHKHSPLTKRVLRSYSIMREHTQDLIDEAQTNKQASTPKPVRTVASHCLKQKGRLKKSSHRFLDDLYYSGLILNQDKATKP